MALLTSTTVPVPVPEYDRLHLREMKVKANGEVDDVKFHIHAVLRRYARGADTGKLDATGKPIYEKHWMPTDRRGATVTVDIKDVENWAAAQQIAGNIANATAVATALGSVEGALAAMLQVEHADTVGTVEVV